MEMDNTNVLLKTACALWHIDERALLNGSRRATDARHAVALVLREQGLSYPLIGVELNIDHTSAIHGVKRAQRLVQCDAMFAERVAQLAACTRLTSLEARAATLREQVAQLAADLAALCAQMEAAV